MYGPLSKLLHLAMAQYEKFYPSGTEDTALAIAGGLVLV